MNDRDAQIPPPPFFFLSLKSELEAGTGPGQRILRPNPAGAQRRGSGGSFPFALPGRACVCAVCPPAGVCVCVSVRVSVSVCPCLPLAAWLPPAGEP